MWRILSIGVSALTALTVAGDVFYNVMTCLTFNITVGRKERKRKGESFFFWFINLYFYDGLGR